MNYEPTCRKCDSENIDTTTFGGEWFQEECRDCGALYMHDEDNGAMVEVK